MDRAPTGLRLARLIFGLGAAIALVFALGSVAPLLTGDPGGCQVVVSLGPAVAVSGVPAPTAPGAQAACTQALDVTLPFVALLLGALLLLTTIRLGQAASSWGMTVAAGAVGGIIAALAAGDAILGIATSDQPTSSPGLGLLLVAALPVLAAIGSTIIIWRGYRPASSG